MEDYGAGLNSTDILQYMNSTIKELIKEECRGCLMQEYYFYEPTDIYNDKIWFSILALSSAMFSGLSAYVILSMKEL